MKIKLCGLFLSLWYWNYTFLLYVLHNYYIIFNYEPALQKTEYTINQFVLQNSESVSEDVEQCAKLHLKGNLQLTSIGRKNWKQNDDVGNRTI